MKYVFGVFACGIVSSIIGIGLLFANYMLAAGVAEVVGIVFFHLSVGMLCFMERGESI